MPPVLALPKPEPAHAAAAPGPSRAPAPAPTPAALGALADPAVLVMVGLLGVSFVALFQAFLLRQHWLSWSEPADWGHAYLVPVISGYLIYQQRDALARARPSVFWPGLVPVVTGIAAYVFGAVGYSNHMIQGWAAILTLFGLVLLLLGPAPMRSLVFPIAYLVCGVTVSEMVMIRVTAPLQQIASSGSAAMLQMLGVTTTLDGTTITVYTSSGTAIPLNIAEACSGLRMLIAFIALGGAMALVACRYWWQRVVLMALAVPVALFINIVRVVVLALASFVNPEFSKGQAHMMIGTFLLVPGFLLYLLVVWVLNRVVAEPGPSAAAVSAQATARPVLTTRSPADWRRLRSPAFLAALAILVVSAAGFNTAIAALKIYLTKKPIYAADGRAVHTVPTETSSWIRAGQDRHEDSAVEEVLGTKNYLSRLYVRKPDASPLPPLDLHLAYYTGMVDTVPHVPERCFVGAGMQISGPSALVPLPLDQSDWTFNNEVPPELAGRVLQARLSDVFGDGHGARINMPIAPAPLDRSLRDARSKLPILMQITPFEDPASHQTLYAGYFFIANGSTVATADGVRLLAFDLTADYAYYLKVQVGSSGVKSPEELAAAAAALLDELLPEIMRCVPDWVQVQSGAYPPDNPRRPRATTDAPPPHV